MSGDLSLQAVYEPVDLASLTAELAGVLAPTSSAERLRETLGDRAPRLVAITGYGQDVDKSRSQAAGFESHLVKPVDLERLLVLLAASRSAS